MKEALIWISWMTLTVIKVGLFNRPDAGACKAAAVAGVVLVTAFVLQLACGPDNVAESVSVTAAALATSALMRSGNPAVRAGTMGGAASLAASMVGRALAQPFRWCSTTVPAAGAAVVGLLLVRGWHSIKHP